MIPLQWKLLVSTLRVLNVGSCVCYLSKEVTGHGRLTSDNCSLRIVSFKCLSQHQLSNDTTPLLIMRQHIINLVLTYLLAAAQTHHKHLSQVRYF
jgi:hypothetical protein